MTKVQVFDPAMCCSTGVCGPSVDPHLVRFAADLDWIAKAGVTVERFNLSQQPGAFVADEDVKKALEGGVEATLPLIKVGGQVKSSGRYPNRRELADWTGVTTLDPRFYSEAVSKKGASEVPSLFVASKSQDCCGGSSAGGCC